MHCALPLFNYRTQLEYHALGFAAGALPPISSYVEHLFPKYRHRLVMSYPCVKLPLKAVTQQRQPSIAVLASERAPLCAASTLNRLLYSFSAQVLRQPTKCTVAKS